MTGARRILLALLATLGCSADRLMPADTPVITSVEVIAGAQNVLSATVLASTVAADSLRVRFGTAFAPLDSLTPAMAVGTAGSAGTSGSTTVAVPVLGLLPDTEYRMQLLAFRDGRVSASETVRHTTGSLPGDLPHYVTTGPDPTPGFVVLAAHPYGLVIDNGGRVVWYRRLEQGPTLNFQAQPNGRYATSPITPVAGDLHPWVEYDALGNETRRLGCAGGLVARFHELVARPDGSWWVLCDEAREMDLTAVGGQARAIVTGTVVQHVGPDGASLFSWSPFDHFAITDLDPTRRTGPAVNWTHGNAIDFDVNGNPVVSFRSLDEITMIDRARGTVGWRLGGRANQFAMYGDSARFAGQHGMRVLGTGELQLFDNRGLSGDSRAMRIAFDPVDRTATVKATISAPPPVTALLGGSTQTLPRGRLLVAYGNGHRVQEYDADGRVMWEILSDPGYVFRAQRIRSLYRPGALDPR